VQNKIFWPKIDWLRAYNASYCTTKRIKDGSWRAHVRIKWSDLRQISSNNGKQLQIRGNKRLCVQDGKLCYLFSRYITPAYYRWKKNIRCMQSAHRPWKYCKIYARCCLDRFISSLPWSFYFGLVGLIQTVVLWSWHARYNFIFYSNESESRQHCFRSCRTRKIRRSSWNDFKLVFGAYARNCDSIIRYELNGIPGGVARCNYLL